MTLKLTAIMLAFALIIPSVANAASRQRLHSGARTAAAASFKVTGIIPTDHLNQKRITQMDKDRIEGVGHQVKGAVKEVAGKVTGDTKTEAEGKAEKAAGKVQNTVGGVKDSLRGK